MTFMLIANVASGAPLDVMVSILPQEYVVKKIGKALVTVHVLLPPGASPATYEPKPAQMAALSASRIFVAQGVPFESAWLPRLEASNPNLIVVHADAGIKKMPMTRHDHHDEMGEGHQDDGEHEVHHHAESADGMVLDPHIWLSPELMRTQAATIAQALQTADPAHKDEYAANLAAFDKEITALQKKLHTILPKNGLFMVFHPSWGYFAREFGLQQIPIENEGKEPSPKALALLIKRAREKNVHVVFVQPQFSRKSAELIASQIPARVIVIDPLAADWEKNLQFVAQEFAQAQTIQ
nr:zinc ABC transporter substrate-binding protein [Desulfovibrio inopinatus]